MKALVTGGSGYLGTHLRNYFNADDLSRRSGKNVLNLEDASAAADYDVVIHLAALLEKAPSRAEEVFRTNVKGTLNILRSIRKDAVFIFASTKDVYGRFADKFDEVPETCETGYAGQSALEWSKLIAEKYVEFYAHSLGFRSCIFRLGNVYAPDSGGNEPGFVGSCVAAINLGERIRLPGGGRAVRDLLHVDDLARACSAFCDSVIRHGTYNLGGGRDNATTLSDLVSKMEEVSGLQAIVDREAPLADPVPFNYVSDLTLIRQELGWQPEIGLERGLGTLFGKSLD